MSCDLPLHHTRGHTVSLFPMASGAEFERLVKAASAV